jgi:ubiquinone/menaquinone biosynthesis C-methylase UbiE
LANPFHDQTVVSRYEDWYACRGRHADLLETALLEKLLAGFAGARNLLDIGCGTGHFTRWFAARDLAVVGIDLSRAMLAQATQLDGQAYVLGDAVSLPFRDGSFDLTSMMTTLEFVTDPHRALSEAVRVSRRGMLLGVLNRWSVQAARRRRSHDPVWSTARFFSPFELSGLIRQVAGQRLQSITWRTTLWHLPFVADLPLPFGDFIAMAARLRRPP